MDRTVLKLEPENAMYLRDDTVDLRNIGELLRTGVVRQIIFGPKTRSNALLAVRRL
jgi:hypothetical protein